MRKGTLKKALALALTGAVLVGAFAGCGAKKDSGDKKETKKIVIGASPSPHADILKVAKKELKKEGYELEIKEYSDYVQPNTALESGDLDANYFQHKPYLDDFNKQKKTHLVSAGTIHYEPFGIFPGKTKALKALKNGATVAVPNVEIKTVYGLAVPIICGFLKPMILLPEREYNKEELKIICIHELIHCKQKKIFYNNL